MTNWFIPCIPHSVERPVAVIFIEVSSDTNTYVLKYVLHKLLID